MHIVTYKRLQLMLLMLCASFDRNLLMTFTVIVEKLLAYFFCIHGVYLVCHACYIYCELLLVGILITGRHLEMCASVPCMSVYKLFCSTNLYHIIYLLSCLCRVF